MYVCQYALIANAYRLIAEDPLNCYEVNFPNSRRTTMCNVASHMLVVFPVTSKNERVMARVNIVVGFNGASVEGDFKCEMSLGPINDFFHSTALPNIGRVMGWDTRDTRLFMSCQKESCFDVDKDIYIEKKSWKEPKQYDLLGGPWS